MKISLKDQAKISPALPMQCAATFTGSALPLEFVDIPDEIGGAAVVAVAATVTNADGAVATAPCEHAGGVWRVTFAASCFEHYGFVERGVSVALTLRDGSGNDRGMVLAVGDLEVKRSSPSAAPGDPEKSYQIKGEDIFVKTRVIDDVQHYARQEMSYDAKMGAWGADWLGDYILVDGEFVPFQAAGGTAATVATALLALLLVPFSSFGITATKEYVDRKDGEIAALSTNIVTTATNALAKAVATNSADIATINSKIPSAASASNQLADKEWIDDEIDTYAAYYITYTAAGAAFPARAALTNATVVYSGGAARTPTRNDYAVVLADESHGGAEWRYIYTVAAGATSGQWDAQYPIETNDYDGLSNKPQINGNELSGNKTAAQLGLATPDDVAAASDAATNYTDSALSTSISPSNADFSNAVLSVGLNIDTNTVAAINALVEQGEESPITGATTVGALLLALAAAVATLKKNKADASELPYALVSITYSSGVQLANRTTTKTTIAAPGSGSTTTASFTMPAPIPGSRDFMLDLTFGADSSSEGDINLSFVEPTPAGGTAPSVVIKFGNVDDVAIGRNILLFSEVPSASASETHWLITARHEDFQ